MKNIVIVTCARDLEQFQLLLLSMDRYLLDTVTLHVIWNQAEPAPKFALTRHELRVYARQQVCQVEGGGWHTQQLYKLFIHSYINDSYLIFDSQTGIIGPVTWDLLVAQAQLHDAVMPTRFLPFARRVSAPHGWIVRPMLTAQTPFWFEHEAMMHIFSMYTRDQLINMFMQDPAPSEFMLHELIRKNCTDIQYTGTCPHMQSFINTVHGHAYATLLDPGRLITSIPSTHWRKARPVFLARLALDYGQHIAYNRHYTGHV